MSIIEILSKEVTISIAKIVLAKKKRNELKTYKIASTAEEKLVEERYNAFLPECERQLSKFNSATERADIASQWGYRFLYGVELKRDFSYAFLYSMYGAKNGDSFGQFNLGEMYCKMDFRPSDCDWPFNPYTGNQWYQKAADQRDTNAMICLANNYQYGIGAEVNYDMSFYWTEKAANLGSVNAMFNLALFYEGEHGMDYTDYNKAGYWFNECARNGDQEAAQIIADSYQYSDIFGKWKKVN